MAADDHRRRGHLDPAELKNLQTIVLDLEELRQFCRTAKRPGVRSILSREICNLESKIVSNSTYSDEKAPEEEEDGGNVNLAETSSKRKRKGRGQPESTMMTKKPKLSAIKKPPVVNGSSCLSMEEELLQQQTRSSEQVLQENANIFDVNEVSHMAVLPTKNTDISNIRSQITRSSVIISATRSGHGPSQKRLRCSFCEAHNHAESECCRLNGTCFNCHEMGHIVKNCPKAPKDAINSSMMKIDSAGSSCESTQEELSQQSIPTKPSDHVSWKKTSHADVNETSVLTVAATENADVSNETSQTLRSPATTVASEYKLGPSQKRKFRHTCHLTHDKSECLRCNGTCFNCLEIGHMMANCPKLPQSTISSCGKIMATTGSSCKSTQEANQESPTGASGVLLDKANSSDVNEVPTMAVVGTENADVSKGKPNLCTIKEPNVIIESSLKSTQEEQNQQPIPTRISEQVLLKKAITSDLNETSPMAVLSTKNVDLFNKMSQIMPSAVVISASGSNHGPSRKRSWCRVCEKSNHTESECYRLNGTCFACHETGHIKKNCPKAPQNVSSPSNVNEETILTIGATEDADVSNEISQTMPQGTAINHSEVKTLRVTKAKVKGKISADVECFYCKGKGHWKRSCAKYLADLKSGKALIPSHTVRDGGS